mmetsp:Transcript_74717/g.215887  ORF Transcript_74717/g.215887 Transcript_74717/m.215887 type:complete len:202 (-) Transcript_74717:25-630(-)
MHSVCEVMPVWSLQVPLGQPMHAAAEEAPASLPQVPAGQAVHTSALVAPCATDQVPRGQAEHCKLLLKPSRSLQRPGKQPVQDSPLGAPSCALQVPGRQLRQALTSLAPRELDHVPWGQRVHFVEPSPLHVPSPQTTHVCTSSAGNPWPAGHHAAVAGALSIANNTPPMDVLIVQHTSSEGQLQLGRARPGAVGRPAPDAD